MILTKNIKILIIRFGAIGDVVMTTPIVRCLKEQLQCEIHYLIKEQYKAAIEQNIYVDKIHIFTKNLSIVKKTIKLESFDFIIDLHKTMRSIYLGKYLNKPIFSFDKISVQRWLYMHTKWDLLPRQHIIDRYFEGLQGLRLKNDQKGMDFFIDAASELKMQRMLYNKGYENKFIAIAIGAAHFTKQMPEELIIDFVEKTTFPVVLIGGKAEIEKSKSIEQKLKRPVLNTVGLYKLVESAAIVNECAYLVTGDTGMMHIGGALRKNVLAVYGSTSPKLGLYPYMPFAEKQATIIERELSCRPCSKHGSSKCPKGHFDCMNKISSNDIILKINELDTRN